MTHSKTIRHRQLSILFCVFLLFCSISDPAFADKYVDVEIIYTVTDDMIAQPSASPSPTASPDAPPKTGDPNQLAVYGLIAGSSMLGLLGVFAYYIKKKERENE